MDPIDFSDFYTPNTFKVPLKTSKTTLGTYANATEHIWNGISKGYNAVDAGEKIISKNSVIEFQIFEPTGELIFNPCPYCHSQVGTMQVNTVRKNVTAKNPADSVRIVKMNDRKMAELNLKARKKIDSLQKLKDKK